MSKSKVIVFIVEGFSDKEALNGILSELYENKKIVFSIVDGDITTKNSTVVEDCGYTSAYDLLAYQREISFRLPSFPGMNLLDWRCRSRAGFSLREAAPIEAVRHARVPMLFIHGTADTLVPASMAETLYAACTSEKELLLVPEAIHSAASQKDAARYDRTVMSFLHGKMH